MSNPLFDGCVLAATVNFPAQRDVLVVITYTTSRAVGRTAAGYTRIITKLSRSPSGTPRGLGGGAGVAAELYEERVLLIEDDTHIAQLIVAELRDAGLTVEWCANAACGLQQFSFGHVGLVILDLNLPDVDGLKVCQRIRADDRVTPILILTARAARQDVVRGLEMGADDYLTKPFDTLELIARLRALLRRAQLTRVQRPLADEARTISRGTLFIDEIARQTSIGGIVLDLTVKEFDLLLLFAKNPGRTFTRDELLARVWGEGFEGYEHTVNTHINRLRSKVESDPKHPVMIETVWGIGYRFAARSP